MYSLCRQRREKVSVPLTRMRVYVGLKESPGQFLEELLWVLYYYYFTYPLVY